MTNTTYDDEEFFSSYLQMRASSDNCNDSLEQPILMDLLSDVRGKRVLDIGCGWAQAQRRLPMQGQASCLPSTHL